MNCGAVAVNLFFALSGYLVSASWQRLGSFRRFMEARTLRIFPAFVLLMLWQAFFVTPISLKTWAAVPSPHQMPRLLAATLSFNSVTPPAPSQGQLFAANTIPGEINGSLWTIRYEFLCYLLLGLAGCASLLNRRWFRLGLFALLLGLFVATPDLDLPCSIETALGRWSYWGRLAVYFLAGTVVYWDARFLRMNGITLVLCDIGRGSRARRTCLFAKVAGAASAPLADDAYRLSTAARIARAQTAGGFLLWTVPLRFPNPAVADAVLSVGKLVGFRGYCRIDSSDSALCRRDLVLGGTTVSSPENEDSARAPDSNVSIPSSRSGFTASKSKRLQAGVVPDLNAVSSSDAGFSDNNPPARANAIQAGAGM